jgi:hypothetical protein
MTHDLEARVVRKISWRILPFVLLLYFVSFLDRVNDAGSVGADNTGGRARQKTPALTAGVNPHAS